MKQSTANLVFWMGTVAFLTAFAIGMFKLHEHQHTTTVKVEEVLVELVRMNPPKHFRVDVREVATGQEHNQIAVSKHFNDWQKLPIGLKFTIQREHYQFTHRKDKTVYVRWVYGSAHRSLEAALK